MIRIKHMKFSVVLSSKPNAMFCGDNLVTPAMHNANGACFRYGVLFGVAR